ncbi:MAG TPA: hypothetical protein VES38_06750 [Methylotenera sp.]|nr:hypothetical protein [Methylotenera sp.]
MAEALIKIKDLANGEVDVEVKFHPAIENNSPAHQLVAEFIKQQKLEEVKPGEG